MLNEIEVLIRDHFGEVLIWDEKAAGLQGKYFYTAIRGIQAGIFLGFTMGSELLKPEKCIVFLFADPKSKIMKRLAVETEDLLRKIMKEIGQKYSSKINFALIKKDLPSLVRTFNIDQEGETNAMDFFAESLLLLKSTACACAS